jgi:hypothetical protein
VTEEADPQLLTIPPDRNEPEKESKATLLASPKDPQRIISPNEWPDSMRINNTTARKMPPKTIETRGTHSSPLG